MKKIACFVLILILFSVCACTPVPVDSGGGYNLLASFYPVYIFTLNLIDGIEGVTLSNMTSGTAGCPHGYSLSQGDMKLLAEADLFIINGAEMELFLEKALNNAAGLKIADSSKGIRLISDDDANEINSHIWMSVPNAIKQTENIYEALLELMPENAELLRENRDAYVLFLRALHEEIKAAAEGVAGGIISFHDAYEYFSIEYNIPFLACIESHDGGEPTARELGELKSMIAANNVKALFVEPGYTGAAASILASETEAEIYVLNPVIAGEAVKTAYEDIMRRNIDVLLSVAQ